MVKQKENYQLDYPIKKADLVTARSTLKSTGIRFLHFWSQFHVRRHDGIEAIF